MALDRAAIYDALFQRLKDAADWASSWRSLRGYDDVAQPAFCINEGRETATQRQGMPPLWKLEAEIFVYVHPSQTATDESSTPLLAYVDAIDAALDSQKGEAGYPYAQTTLGGLVSHVWISEVETDPGAVSEQALASIKIEIYAPATRG